MEFFSYAREILPLVITNWKLVLILSIIFALHYYYTARYDHFQKRGIPFKKPTFLFGNLVPRATGDLSFHEVQRQTYNHFKGLPFGGHFEGRKPILNIFDLDLIKAITIRDFDHFTDRGRIASKEPRYLQRLLVNLKGEDWKAVRSSVTPAFSPSKLRHMVPLIEQCAQLMVTFLKQYEKNDVEMKRTMGHYSLEVIGACAFGIKCDALSDENAHFIKVAEKHDFMPRNKRLLISFLLIFLPQLIRFLPISFLNTESTDELVRLLRATKVDRRESGSKNNDFLQILLDFAEDEKSRNLASEIHLDDATIDGQLILFLIAGYDTTSSLLSFAIHVLATKPELQEKLRANVVEMTDGKEMSYELIAQMTYLEAFLLETLRIYPPSARIGRVCTKPYVLPGTTIQLKPGETVIIPFYGHHMDPDLYSEPNEFRPERFLDEQNKVCVPQSYFAFGSGPRNCIGTRFALISAKVAMVALLNNYNFLKCERTEDPVTFVKKTLVLKPKNGLWIRLERL